MPVTVALMSHLLALLCYFFAPSPRDVEALRKSAPFYLTEETAETHLIAARGAAYVYKLDPDLLLSIAHHESRYMLNNVTPERGGKESCGVLTPVPLPRGSCDSEPTAASGYRAGAEHLRGWMDVCGNRVRCALIGYAGGYALIYACKKGPVLRFTDRGDDLCRIPDVFLHRAAYIRTLRAREARA